MAKNIHFVIYFFFGVACLFLTPLHAQETVCLDKYLKEVSDNTVSSGDSGDKQLEQLWADWRKNIYQQPDQAFNIAETALKLTLNSGLDTLIGTCLLRMGNARQYEGNVKDALSFIDCAIVQEEKYNNPKKLSIALGDKGKVLYNGGQLDSAMRYLNKSLIIAQNHGLARQEAFALLNQARVYNEKGFYKLAVDKNLSALKLYESIKDTRSAQSVLNTLGITHVYSKNYKQALSYFNKLAELLKNAGPESRRFYAEAILNTAYSHQQLNHTDSALYYYEKALFITQEVGDAVATAIAQGGIAKGLSFNEQHDQALHYFERAELGFDTLEIPSYRLNHLIDYASALIAAGNINKAGTLQQLIKKDYALGLLNSKENWLELQIDYAREIKNMNLAFGQMRTLNHLKDSLNLHRKAIEIEELRMIYDLEKKQAKIELLELRQKTDIWRIRTLIAGLLLLAATALFSILFIRKRAKVKKQENELELANIELEKKRLANMISEKNRALTAQSIHNANQKGELQELKKSLQDLATRYSVPTTAYGGLIKRIDQNLSNDEGWEKMIEAFRLVQPDFIDDLIKDYPNLTSSDLRLATLLRMNLHSKTIANLINISPDSVKRARNRFRQKVDIPSDIRLQDWILAR